MGIILSSNIDLQGGLPLDSRYGPYSSTTQANQSIITANRFVGLTVGIVTGTTTYNGLQLTDADGGIADYWYYTGITDSDLVLKQGESGDLVNVTISEQGEIKSFRIIWKKTIEIYYRNPVDFEISGRMKRKSLEEFFSVKKLKLKKQD